ncbi:unnamed protein product, partial [Allacma fusca]
MHLPALWLVLLLILSSNARIRIRRSSPEERAGLFEGDIVLPKEEAEFMEEGKASSGIIGSHYRWAHASIPYVISNHFDFAERIIIREAMLEIMRKTCIRFICPKGDANYIFIQDGEGCSSFVGRRGEKMGQ